MIPDTLIYGAIDFQYVTNNFTVLVDRKYSKTFYVFDKKNKFLHDFSYVGNGPNEYASMSSITVNPNKDEIYVLDRIRGNIQIYDIVNGNHLHTIFIRPFNLEQITYFNNELFYYSTNKPENNEITSYFLGKVTWQGKVSPVISEYPKINNQIPIGISRNFSQWKDKLYFSPTYTNKIYEIDTTTKISTHIELKNKFFLESYDRFLEKKGQSKLIMMELNRHFKTIDNLIINDDFYHFDLSKDGYAYIGFLARNDSTFNVSKAIVSEGGSKFELGGERLQTNTGEYVKYVDLDYIYELYTKAIKMKRKVPEHYHSLMKNYKNKILLTRYIFNSKIKNP